MARAKIITGVVTPTRNVMAGFMISIGTGHTSELL